MNDSEDEDRKFFRAAAEAIVATSMNNPIDPTILELLRRIQYASLSKTNGGSQSTESFLHQQLAQQSNPQQQQQQQNLGLIDSTKAANFPTFNLNYFGLQGGASSTDVNNNNSNNSNRNGTSHNQQGTNHSRESSNAHFMDSWKPSTSNTRTSLKSDSLDDPGPKHSPAQSDHHTPKNQQSDHNSRSNTPRNPFTDGSSSSAQNQGGMSPDDGESKPFICRDCTLSFRRSSDLRRHQRAHLPVLPHICQRCGKGFARKDALKRHTDTLTCKRNRERLLSSGGDLEGILSRANEIKRRQLDSMDEDDEDDEDEGDY